MPDEKFKLPNSSYEELIKIVMAYGKADKPVSLSEVGKRSAIHETTVSRNTGFLTAVGILEPGAKKAPTPLGKSLANALEYKIPDKISNCWQQVIMSNDFFEKLISAIKIRNGMDEATLEAHIAYSAGRPKTIKLMTGARTVVDILRIAGEVLEIDGKITTRVEEIAETPEYVNLVSKRESGFPAKGPQTAENKIGKSEEVRFNIQVNINCTPAELGGLAGKLKTLIKELSLDRQSDGKREQ